MMVTEFAEIEVRPGQEEHFRDAVEHCKPLFARAPGCHGIALQQSVEQPQHFVLLVKWDSVEHHMEMFQKSPDFEEWREAVGDCFAAPPKVWHGQTVVASA